MQLPSFAVRGGHGLGAQCAVLFNAMAKFNREKGAAVSYFPTREEEKEGHNMHIWKEHLQLRGTENRYVSSCNKRERKKYEWCFLVISSSKLIFASKTMTRRFLFRTKSGKVFHDFRPFLLSTRWIELGKCELLLTVEWVSTADNRFPCVPLAHTKKLIEVRGQKNLNDLNKLAKTMMMTVSTYIPPVTKSESTRDRNDTTHGKKSSFHLRCIL